MKKRDFILMAGMIMSILFTNFTDFGKTLYSFENEVLRMHILANSDSQEDQQLKIRVRDELLKNSEEIFGECENLQQMKETAEENKELINKIAVDTIKKYGYNYTVNTEIANMEFDNRQYGNITMPAGNYDTVRVTIGEAKGHNWWCVMYPPLCIPAAQEVSSDEEITKEYFDEKQVDILENPQDYQIKFKCIEWFDAVKDEICSWFW